MKTVISGQDAKRIDQYTIEKVGIPGLVLMERAAVATVCRIEKMATKKDRILCVCGTGNNGGDGIAIARILFQRGYDVSFVMVGNLDKATEDNKRQRAIARELGLLAMNTTSLSEYTIIIDAIFGVGLTREVQGEYAQWICDINASNSKVVAVDIPSGIDSERGQIMGVAVKATATVTYGFEKYGLLLFPGAEYAGVIYTEEVGFARLLQEDKMGFYYEEKDLKQLLPQRHDYSNKGSYGKVLLIAGSKNMAGACVLAAEAAYRMGTGLVRILTVEENREIVQTLIPEAVLVTYDKDKVEEELVRSEIAKAKAIAIGPGLGCSHEARKIVTWVLDNAKVPVVMDADALQLVAENKRYVNPIKGNRAKWNFKANVILTPHMKEFSDLLGGKISVKELQENILQTRELMAENENILVLKDARSIVLQGEKCYINLSGNNGMATGGSGDVLTGVILGLLAQGLEPYDAATVGTYLHGLSGDKAAKQYGRYAMTARNIVGAISEVLLEIEQNMQM